MLNFKYAYLIGTIVFLIPWVILFFFRKDYRKEMIFMSLVIGIGSVITAYLWWTIDWWRPETITNTRVGIEDFLMGFSNGGIAAVLYEGIFKKRLLKRIKEANNQGTLNICLILFFIIAFLFWGLNITSFWASTIAMIIAAIYILYTRRDLFLNALASGILMAIASLPFYHVLIWFFPGFIHKTWMFQYLSGITIIGIPFEDLIFYFLFGFIIGPLYEYWQNKRLVSI
jgi:hypothetical protein